MTGPLLVRAVKRRLNTSAYPHLPATIARDVPTVEDIYLHKDGELLLHANALMRGHLDNDLRDVAPYCVSCRDWRGIPLPTRGRARVLAQMRNVFS